MIPQILEQNHINRSSISVEDTTEQHELFGAFACLVITRIAFAVFESCYFQILAVAVTSFLLTSVAKKILQQYISLKEIERVFIVIVRKWPHLHIVTGIAASILHAYVPLVSTLLATGMGTSAAFVFRVKKLSTTMTVQPRRA
jgi:hypothetical protein